MNDLESLHDTGGDLVSASLPHRRSSGTPVWLILLSSVFAFLVVGGALAWVFIVRPRPNNNPGNDAIDTQTFRGYLGANNEELVPAFQLVWRKGKWTQNDLSTKIAKRMRSQDQGKRICLLQEIPTEDPQITEVVWVAVAAKDYVDKRPSDAELVRQAIFRLSACFRNEGDIERLATEKLPPEKFNDKDIEVDSQVIRFQGDFGAPPQWTGKVYAFTHHGFGYWVIVGGTESNVMKTAFEKFQDVQNGLGFRFWDEREGWRPEPPKIITYRAEKIALSLQAPEGIWQQKAATDYDAGGLLYLRGEAPHAPQTIKNLKAAHVLVFKHNKATPTLEKAMEAGRDYVLNRHKQLNETYDIRNANAQAPDLNGTAKKLGNLTAQVIDLQLTRDAKPVQYIKLAVVRTSDSVYGIECLCQWEFRDVWSTEFESLLKTLAIPN